MQADDAKLDADQPSRADGSSLESVLDRYLDELADGKSPDQELYLREHPELAEALRGVFRTLDFVETTSKSLNASKLEGGRRLGDYRIVREIGRGGMGVVYEAIQSSMNRRVALKVLPPGVLLSDSAPERFAREAATAGRLHHTNIVPVFAVGQEQGVQYYSMQYIENGSLAERLKEMRAGERRIDKTHFERVMQWGKQAAEALTHAHAAKIIHRDIKPSNLLLDAQDNVWLTDFGLAREDALTTLTLSGDVIGTARYMSPEQARGDNAGLDGRTDVYSLGAMLYEMLTLTPAYDGDSREAVLNRIATSDPTPLRKLASSIPRDVETIIMKCMEKQPERRYAGAAEVAEDCRRYLAGEPVKARRTPLIVKAYRYVKRHRTYAALATAGVVLALATALLGLKIRSERGAYLLESAYDAVLFKLDLPRAEALLDEAADWGVDSAELHLCRGLIPLSGNDSQRAIPHLLKAQERAPDSFEIASALSAAYYATGDTVNGTLQMGKHAGQDSETALGWLLRGYSLVFISEDEAIGAYNRALEIRADFTPAIRARATSLASRMLRAGSRDDMEQMIKDYNAWVTFWPQSHASYSARATGWLFAAAYAGTQPDLRERQSEFLANCVKDLDQAAKILPDSTGVLSKRGSYYRFIGDYESAERAFTKAMELDRIAKGDVHPGMIHHHALALHALGELERADEEVAPAIEQLPTFAGLPLQRVFLLAESGRLEEARQLCLTGIERFREDFEILPMFLVTLELAGGAEEARQIIDYIDATVTIPEALGVQAARDFKLLMDFLTDRIDGDALIEAVRDDPSKRCMVAYLTGIRRLARGEREAGRAALQECLDTGIVTYMHFRFAQVWLARMAADPEWPGWIEN